MSVVSSGADKGQKLAGTQYLEIGNAEYDNGNFRRALEMFDSAVAAGENHEVVYNNRGAALDALGRFEEAVESYQRAVAVNPSYELAWHNLGNCLFGQELFADAARSYSRAANANPKRKENWSGLAASYIRMGRTAKAKRAIAQLEELTVVDPTALLLQAALYADAQLLEEARECCRRYISKHTSLPEGHALLGRIEYEAEDYHSSVKAFEKAVELMPGDKDSWNSLGFSYFSLGHLDRALAAFDRAIDLDPSYKQAWYNRGYALHGADRLEEAVECYERAIALDPVDKVLWNNLGNALYNLGRYVESMPKFVEALKVDADYEIAWNNIGNALEKLEAWTEAIPYHDRSLEVSPSFDYALYAKGVCRANTDDLEGGYDLILESLYINPTYDEAWKARARVALDLGRRDDALMSIEESLAVNPEFDEGWAFRGEILMDMGEAEAAQASFEMALSCLLATDTATASGLNALLRRAEVLARLGRFEDALADVDVVALTGKLDANAIPKALELRRILGRLELPEALHRIAKSSPDQGVRLALAEFLIDVGEREKAREIIEGLDQKRLGTALVVAKARVAPDASVAPRPAGTSSAAERLRDPLFLRFKCESLMANGKHRMAAETCRTLIDRQPSDFDAAITLARSLLMLGDYRGCLRTADMAIGIDSRDPEPFRLKAEAYKALGEKQKERASREMAAQRTPVRKGQGAKPK